MLNKDIKFSVSADFGEFDRQVEAMQKKMQQMSSPANYQKSANDLADRAKAAGIGGGASASDKMRADQLEKQKNIETDRFLRMQFDQHQKIGKVIDNVANRMAALRADQSKLNKDTAEYLRIQEQINRLGENASRLEGARAAKGAFVDSQLPTPPSGFVTYTGPGGNGGGGGGIFGNLAPSAIAAMIRNGLNKANMFSSDLQRNQASVAQNTYGQLTGSLFSGALSRDMLFSKERAESFQRAGRESTLSKAIDAGMSLGSIGLGLSGAAVSGVMGTALGMGPLGWTALAAGGLAYGAHSLYKGMKGGYAQEAAANAQEYLANEKALNPLKTMAAEKHYGSIMQTVGNMRRLGLSENDYRDMLIRGTGQGFGEEQTLGMINDIGAAGGSTQMMRQGAASANIYAKQQGLTNAGGILGKLSSGMDFANSNNSLLKIMSEATRIGLDNSDYREEQRKFAAATTEAIMASGARTGDAAGGIAAMMASGVAGAGITGAGIDASAQAVQKLMSSGREGGGIRGVLGAQFIAKNETLGKLGAEDRALIQTTDVEKLISDENLMASFSQKTGSSVEDIKKSLYGLRTYKADPTGKVDRAVAGLKQKGYNTMGVLSPDFQEKLDIEAAGLRGTFNASGLTDPNASMESFRSTLGILTGKGGTATGVMPKDTSDKTSASEKEIEAAAAQQKQTLEMVKDMGAEFRKAASDGKEFAMSLGAAVKELKTALDNNDTKAADAARTKLGTMNKTLNQAQGSPGMGAGSGH